MSENTIELIDIAGSLMVDLEVQFAQKLGQLYEGQLMRIGNKKLYDFDGNLDGGHDTQERYRFVVAKNHGEHEILLKVQPFRLHLQQNKKTQVIEANPYQSMRWLKTKIQKSTKSIVKLALNGQQLPQSSNSILKFLSSEDIINIVGLKQSEKYISILYTKQPGSQAKIYPIQNVPIEQKVDWLTNHISKLTGIPHDYLYLVYGGKILPKDRLILEYNIENNGCIYAVDSRKYMKKISQNEHHHKLSQVKKRKQTNKAMKQKVRQTEKKNCPIVIKQTDVYQDQQGLIHQHNQEKSVFTGGKQTIVETDVAQDEKGNLIKIQYDEVNIEKDPKTGNTIKLQTDVIEEKSQNSRTIIKKSQIKDREGKVIKKETDVFKQENLEKGSIKQERDIIQDDKKITEVDNQVIEDKKGYPTKIQTDILERNQDQRGNMHQYSKQIKEQDGVTTVIQRNVVQDKQGNLIQVKTDIIKITQDELGNVYKHERSEINKEKRRVIIERDIVTDKKGELISRETDMKIVEEDKDKNIHRHETDIIEGADGKTIVIEKSILEDSKGNILKFETDMFELNKEDQEKPLQQREIYHEAPEVVIIPGQKQPMINGGKQVTIDQQGNTHVHEKQLVEKQGKTIFIDRDTTSNPQGKILKVQTDIVQIQGDEQGNMHKHKSQMIECSDQVVMIETDTIVNPDGVVLREEKDTIEIDQGEDGSTIKNQKDVIEEEGKTKIIEKQTIEDAEGNIIRSQTKITQIQDTPEAINVHEKEEIIQAVEDDQVDNLKQVNKSVEILQDEQGNKVTNEKQITEDQEGRQTIVYRSAVENKSGEIVREQTQMVHISDKGEKPEIHRHVVDYVDKQNKVVIQQSTLREGLDGQIIRCEKQTIEIEKEKDGTIHTRQTDVVEEGGVIKTHETFTIEDEAGQLISKNQNFIKLESPKREKNRPPQLQVEVIADKQGNICKIEKQTIKVADNETRIIQTTTLENPNGDLVCFETNLLEIEKRQSGTQFVHETNITQGDNKLIVTENKSVATKDGEIISSQTDIVELQADQSGHTKRTETNVLKEAGETTITSKTAIQEQDGSIHNQSLNVTKIIEKADGEIEIIQKDYQPLEQDQRKNRMEEASSDKNRIKIEMRPMEQFGKKVENAVEKEVEEDEKGNIHTYKKQVLQQGQTYTVIKSETIQNPEGKVVEVNINIVDTTPVQNGKILKKETEIISNEKLTTTQTYSIQNADGKVIREESQKIQLQETEGLIKTSKVDIVKQEDKVTVYEQQILQDEDGIIIDKSTNNLDIDQSSQAVQKQVKKIAQAQASGEVKGVVTKYEQDSLGNKHIKEREEIEDHGKTIIVENETIQSPQGKVLKVQTEIRTSQELQDGKIATSQTEILEENGKVKVIEISSVKENEQGLQKLKEEMREKK